MKNNEIPRLQHNVNKKNVRANAQDFLRITPEKVTEQFIELIKIAQCADIAMIAFTNLDMSYKSPMISNHIKRIKESSEAIRKELRNNPKFGFKSYNNEYAENASGELYNLLGLAMLFGTDGLEALNVNLRLQLQEPGKMADALTALNNMVENEDYIGGKIVMFANALLFRAADNLKSGKPNQADTVDQIIVKNTRVSDLINQLKKDLNLTHNE